MDHSGMDHGDMGGGHGGMDDMCSMNMLFTWDTTNLCIISKHWHIRSNMSLVLSLLAIVALTAGYEYLRFIVARKFPEESQLHSHLGTSNSDGEAHVGVANISPVVERRRRIRKSVYYAIQVFYSFMVMLLFMTYNVRILPLLSSFFFLYFFPCLMGLSSNTSVIFFFLFLFALGMGNAVRCCWCFCRSLLLGLPIISPGTDLPLDLVWFRSYDKPLKLNFALAI